MVEMIIGSIGGNNMRKSLLLIALPALLALSSCNAIKGNAKQNNFDYFKEDTLAHEEFFGGSELAPRKLGNPEEDPTSEPGQFTLTPKIGVQFQNYTKDVDPDPENVVLETFYVVRYVAAVSLTSLDGVTAEWKRAVSDKAGDEIKTWNGGQFSTELYPTLNSGSTPVNATSESGGEYKNYLVYSMYGIPASHLTSYIAAYLTLSKAGQTDVKSKVVATQFSGNHYFSFADNKEAGYFIQGRINGTNQIKDLDDDPTEATDHAEKRSVGLKENDEFGCFYYDPGTSFKFFGYDNNVGDSVFDYYLEQSGSTQYFKLRANGTYDLFMSDADSFSVSDPVNPTVTLYFHPGTNWRDGSPKYAVWYNSTWHKFVESATAGSGYYELEGYDFINYDKKIVFARYNPADENPSWGPDPAKNVWDQSSDQDYPKSGFPNRRVANIYDDDWNNARVSWTVLS